MTINTINTNNLFLSLLNFHRAPTNERRIHTVTKAEKTRKVNEIADGANPEIFWQAQTPEQAVFLKKTTSSVQIWTDPPSSWCFFSWKGTISVCWFWVRYRTSSRNNLLLLSIFFMALFFCFLSLMPYFLASSFPSSALCQNTSFLHFLSVHHQISCDIWLKIFIVIILLLFFMRLYAYPLFLSLCISLLVSLVPVLLSSSFSLFPCVQFSAYFSITSKRTHAYTYTYSYIYIYITYTFAHPLTLCLCLFFFFFSPQTSFISMFFSSSSRIFIIITHDPSSPSSSRHPRIFLHHHLL